jgi:uncharacterized protein
VIVADSGPLIAFALLRQLDLLRTLYKSVLVPPAVWAEVTDNSERPGAVEIREADWLERVPAVRIADALLLAELGLGETEAICLSIERGGERGGAQLLVDERKARRIARVVYNLPVRGTIGTLAAAKRAGLIPAVRPLLVDLVARGYFIAPSLVETACAELGE